MIYSFNSQIPEPIPFRIRLSDGRVRTDPSSFTEEEIADAGYTPVRDMPTITSSQRCYWSSELIDWVVENKTAEELEIENQRTVAAKWNQIRENRDQLMKEFEWRYVRHNREIRLGLTLSDSIEEMDIYMQALADITTQSDCFNIVWPIYEENL